MGDKPEPAKHIHVNSIAVGGLNITVNKMADVVPKAKAGPIPPPPLESTMNDPQLDKAIDDIIVSESNEVLTAEDATLKNLEAPQIAKKRSFKNLLKSKWFYLGLIVVIAAIALFSVPDSRYRLLGKFLKEDYKVTIIDSVTDTPVSGAKVIADKQVATTNAKGQATLKLPVGKQKYIVSKHYYAQATGQLFVGLLTSKGQLVKLKATGRQVLVTINNKLSGRRLAGVNISVLNTSAITNSFGQAQIVLPTKKATYEATISANGFNTFMTPITVTTSKTLNTISLTPSGYIYYLSNLTGTIDVNKANLDGSNPVIELAGTGNETASTTTLMASPDWQYLVLEARRNTSGPELYLINAATGQLTEFDSAAASFTTIGWSGDQFIYDEVETSANTSTVGRQQIKSYNAATGQLNILDQNQVVGSSPSYAYQSFSNFELLPNLVVYTTSWNSVGSYNLASQDDTIRSVGPNGLGQKDYSSFPASTTGVMKIVKNSPDSLYISINNTSTNQTSYYQFVNDAVGNSSSASFSLNYPTYYLSPSNDQSLWTVSKDNQLVTYIGNESGQDGKQVSLPAGYSAAGWYDNIYILLTKDGQLYIAPASGISSPTLIGSYLAS